MKFVTPDEARQLQKRTKGFCGYDWMVDSIIQNGRVIARYTNGEIYARGSFPRTSPLTAQEAVSV